MLHSIPNHLPNVLALYSPQRFDYDWRFNKRNIDGAEAPEFDDSKWRILDLPHDWSIEDLTTETNEQSIVSGPFDSEAPGGINSGFTVGGESFYRKHFTLPSNWHDKSVTITFDGVYMNSDVWINGHHLGCHPYGYTSFYYELSPYLHYGNADNVIAVHVRNDAAHSRWYAGSGIYRHVWLKAAGPIHIAQWGTYITTPKVNADQASVRIQTTIENRHDKKENVSVVTTILDNKSHVVAKHTITSVINSNTSDILDQSIQVNHPWLWSPESPNCYKAVVVLKCGDEVMDRSETVFGIRSIRFDPDKGFFLNGVNMKLKGGCAHANNGPLGAAAFDRAEERRVELLKAAGFNCVRCAHNPPSTAFLEACDRLGMMVIDESFDSWNKPHPPMQKDYSVYFKEWWQRDLESMLQRDRNHPSIIIWSIGNQIIDSTEDSGVQSARELTAFAHKLDPTRPVTSNVYRWWSDWKQQDRFMAELDVAGYSYAREHYDEDHKRCPKRIMLSTEIDPIHSFENWMDVLDRDFVCGNFEWTALDHMGEVSTGWWSFGYSKEELYPWYVSYCGDFDICGFKRPRSYYRDALWGSTPQVSAFVHSPTPSFKGPEKISGWGWDDVKASWTWPGYEDKPLRVDIYSNCDRVTLLLNNKEIGTKPTTRDTKFIASWDIPYKAGTLTAIGFKNDKEVKRWTLQTAGKAEALRLTADRNIINADGQNLCYVTVEAVDAEGNSVPNVDNLVHFNVTGEGSLAATGNSNPTCMESFQQPQHTLYEGRCLVVLKSSRQTGKLKLTATAEGLKESAVEIKTHKTSSHDE